MSSGIDWEKLEALEAHASDPRFSPRERAALEFAERMTRTDLDLDDACFARARAEFADDELVELAAVAAMENFRSKFNNAFRIEAQGFCAVKKGRK